jgi:DNA polymerase alpha subunit A
MHSFIPYIICLYKEEDNNDIYQHKVRTISDRAYHPKEIESDPELKIDYVWYKENQILPVVKRLVQHIGEITVSQLCESLGIDNKSNEYEQEQNNESGGTNNSLDDKKFKVRNIEVRNGIYFKCPHCKKLRHIKKLITREKCIREILQCNKCKEIIKKEDDFNMIANIIKYTAKNLMFLYYRKKSTCSACKESNNCLFCRRQCPDKTCSGHMETDFDEISIFQELKFLNELANTDNNNELEIKNFNNAMKKIKNYLKNLNDKLIFTRINITDAFSFLNPDK